MPETRYEMVYNLAGELIEKRPYEVSDEQLAEEADSKRLKEIVAMGHSVIPLPLLAEGFALLCKKLGYS